MKDAISLVPTLDVNTPVNSAVLLARATRLAVTNRNLPIVTGNSIVLYAMFVLQQTLAQESLNPVANVASLVALSNSIASLKSTLSS